MEIDKISFKNKQCWITFKSKAGEYMGTLHLVEEKFFNEVKDSFKDEQ